MEARVSTRGRVVIPKEMRRQLRLRPGDLVRFMIDAKDGVTIDKVLRTDRPFENFGEWASAEDERIYADL